MRRLGTARALQNAGIPVERVYKIHEGRPHVLDLVVNREVRLIINTPSGRRERSDDRLIRSSAASHRIPCITTLAAASATIQGMENWMKKPLAVAPLQEHHAAFAPQEADQAQAAEEQQAKGVAEGNA